MIVEGWHGVLNRKGELLCVEEGADAAAASALNLELDDKRPTNKVVPVTVLIGKTAGEAFQEIAERVVERIKFERANPVGAPYHGPKEEKKSPTDIA
jgi:hypothetical protein